MFDRKLKEAMELLGGRAVVKDSDQYYVLLTLKEFKKIRQEGLEGLTKQELVDRINNDIAIWKIAQEEKEAQINLDELETSESETVHYENPMV
jgi:hypothetical protein